MPFLLAISGSLDPYPVPPVTAPRSVESVLRTAPTHAVTEHPREGEQVLPPTEAPVGQREAASAYRRAAGEGRHQTRPALVARDVMTRPVTTLPLAAPLGEARRLFTERGFRHVPIVDRALLVGMISDRDLLGHQGEETTVGAIMQNRVVVATLDTPVREVARVLLHEAIGSLPILADDRTLIGILTTSDLLEALVHRAPLDLWV